LARLRRGEAAVEVEHGSAVERGDGFFVEGAWDGGYGEGGFADAWTLLGSGGRIVDTGSLVFATPTHIYERLYALRLGDALFVSNSLVFLLARSGEALDEDRTDYAGTLYRRFGMTAADRRIPTRAGNQVGLYYQTNLVVGADLRIRTVAKRAPAPFPDFRAYRRFLATTVAAVFRNATHPGRRVRHTRPVTAISSGYDSTATAVLARAIGCTDALTFTAARPLAVERYTGGDDSGRPVAEALGLTCREIGRLDYLASDREFPEAEIFATAHLVDLNILSLEPHLDDQAILFTGFRGDIMWNREIDTNQDSGGPGLAEFRLRLGFVHFPLPYLGTVDCRPDRCRNSASVRAISNSTEMAPWSIGGDYDRPIPRRIVEEAGVARGAFGRIKRASAVWYGREAPEDILQGASYRDFQAFRGRVAGPEANQCLHWGMARIQDRYR